MARKKKGRVGSSTAGFGLPSAPGLGGAPTYSTSPQAPVNPYVSQAPPIDPQYEASRVSAQRNTALGDADAVYQGARLDNAYGLGADQSNPYSQAKLLTESHRRAQRGTTNSYASQGQLYSGAYQRMKAENDRDYNIGFDRISRDYQDAKYGIARDRAQSYADSAAGLDEESFRRLLRALGGV